MMDIRPAEREARLTRGPRALTLPVSDPKTRGDPRTHFSQTGTDQAMDPGLLWRTSSVRSQPQPRHAGTDLEETRWNCIAGMPVLDWAFTHLWELEPYLLFLSYLFTSVVCQILY